MGFSYDRKDAVLGFRRFEGRKQGGRVDGRAKGDNTLIFKVHSAALRGR